MVMTDLPTTELKELTKTSTPTPPEQPATPATPQPSVTKDSARGALESIAHPETDQILTNASQLYLDAGDSRLLLTALASQTASSPLASEFRKDVLTMIGNSNLPGFEDLKKQVADLAIPKKDPAQSEFVAFIGRYNSTHPGGELPQELTNAIKTGQVDSANEVAQTLQENSALSESLWTEMIGKDKPRPQMTNASGLLTAAKLEANETNRAKAEKLFAPLKVKKDIKLGDLVPSVLAGAMLLSFVMQLATTESGQSQGH